MNKLQLVFTIVGFALSTCLSSQTSYTLPKGKKSIFFNEVNQVSIVGTTDNTARIEIEGSSSRHPERAQGLKLINGSGYEDNTDIGLSVEENGDELIIREVSNRSNQRYTFYVPVGYFVKYQATSNRGGKLNLENIEAELDISTLFNSISMSGVKGPMTIHSVHGRIEAIFDQLNQEGPINLYSVHGHLDISIPQNTKADLMMSSGHGEIYSNVDMKIEKNINGLNKISNGDIRAAINGGGVKLSIKSQHGDIYLRNL